MHSKKDGTRSRAEIVVYIEEFEGEAECVKFRVRVGDEKFAELFMNDEMCDFIEEQAQNIDGTWRFRKIIGHRTSASGNAMNQ